jgi:hypothetical protein
MFCPTTERVYGRMLVSMLNQSVESFDVMLARENPVPYEGGRVMRNIKLNYEKMRQTVLRMEYDKVWVLEEDMIAPPDALEKLLEVDAPVVTGLYVLRHGIPISNIFLDWRSGTATWKELEKTWGQTIEVQGGAMGCLLLDRSVLEGFCFKVKENIAPDTEFMAHCVERRIRQMARLDVECGHIRADGSIVWPDAKRGYRTEDA